LNVELTKFYLIRHIMIILNLALYIGIHSKNQGWSSRTSWGISK